MTWDHSSEESQDTPSAEEIAELDRRWAAIEAGEATVPNDVVMQWLQTWGTPEFKPWFGDEPNIGTPNELPPPQAR